MSATLEREYDGAKTLIASFLTGEIRCVPSDSAAFMATLKVNQWFVVCSEPEELRQMEAAPRRRGAAAPSGPSTFIPVGAFVRRTASALSYVPGPFLDVMTLPGRAELRMMVNHFTWTVGTPTQPGSDRRARGPDRRASPAAREHDYSI